VAIVVGILFAAAVVSAAEPDSSDPKKDQTRFPWKMERLPFPASTNATAPLSFQEIEATADRFNDKLGGYPPRFSNPDERITTYAEWIPVVLAAERLKEPEGFSERMATLLATLYRQGHNMEVADCGNRAHATITAGLEKYPQSIPINFQASYFYTQIDPKFAPEGERASLRLRRLLRTDKNFEVERNLLVAYLFQDKIKEAKKQVDRCLKIRPDDVGLLRIKGALQRGKIERRIQSTP